jgi:hypothetical protein
VAPGSTTTNRNFKVKHGLDVADGGTFGSTVTVATPTENSHAATKLYVDTAVGSPQIPVSGTAPVSPDNGDLWFDTLTQRVHVYYNSQWVAIATLEDAEDLQDHIHDTSIEGSGLVVGTFIDGGTYNESGRIISGGSYNTSEFNNTLDGGLVSDVYSLFVDGGAYNEEDGILVNAGFYYTEEFEAVYNGGLAA